MTKILAGPPPPLIRTKSKRRAVFFSGERPLELFNHGGQWGPHIGSVTLFYHGACLGPHAGNVNHGESLRKHQNVPSQTLLKPHDPI